MSRCKPTILFEGKFAEYLRCTLQGWIQGELGRGGIPTDQDYKEKAHKPCISCQKLVPSHQEFLDPPLAHFLMGEGLRNICFAIKLVE